MEVKGASASSARPKFIKLAPRPAATERGVEHLVIHTGQHYDKSMSTHPVLAPEPDLNLNVVRVPYAEQTVGVLTVVERHHRHEPDWVLV